VYVDDLLLICRDTNAMELFLSALEDKFKEINVQRGALQEYLGMVFDFGSVPSKVCVSMKLYIEALLHDYDVCTSVATPATSMLFLVRDDSPMLNTERTASFHSGVMRLMFLAKRARPDVLTATVFLSSRVLSPTEDDWNKFIRVLKYLHSTQDITLHLSLKDTLSIHAYIDASFAVHNDMKSHTGSVITLGLGAIYIQSTKQKLMSKSSTEAELIALSDALGQVIWTRNFLESLGYIMEPATILQDNMSTIAMIKNGAPTSARTRHINIRFFFAKDRVDNGEIKIVYCPTEDMWADLFTKPLQGAAFKRLRDLVLGISK